MRADRSPKARRSASAGAPCATGAPVRDGKTHPLEARRVRNLQGLSSLYVTAAITPISQPFFWLWSTARLALGQVYREENLGHRCSSG